MAFAHTIETVKNIREVLRRNPAAGIRNLSHDLLVTGDKGHGDSIPFLGVPDGVLDEVFKDPFNESNIGRYEREICPKVCLKPDLLLFCNKPDFLDNVLYEFAQGDRKSVV